MSEQSSNNSSPGSVSSVVSLPGYQIKDVLGKGGMAVVYLAIQESIGRQVALKILAPDHTDESFTDRFLREARIISNLAHPNIITVYDAGVHQGCHYMSMEYVPGNSLRESRDKLSRLQKIDIIKQVGHALDYAGNKGYVHRDIKPENILLHEDGRAILTDFGIARSQHATQGLTMTGKIVGTPYYMSPEQAKGIPVDHRSDIYSLGVVLFQALSGYLPYDGPSVVAIGIKHISDPIPELPDGLELFQPIINTCLSKDPAHRYPSAAEFVQALEQISESELDYIEARANARLQATQLSGKDHHARTIASHDAISSGPVLQADQIRHATPAARPGRPDKQNRPQQKPFERDITASDDFKRLRRRRRTLLLMLLVIFAGLGYYRQADLILIWDQKIQPLLTELQQTIQQPAANTPDSPPPGDLPAVPADTEISADPAHTQAVIREESVSAQAHQYRQLLNENPADLNAQNDLQAIARWYDEKIRQHLTDQQLPAARQLVDQARQDLPPKIYLSQLNQTEQSLLLAEAISNHLRDASQYIQQGAYTTPAGKNALDEIQIVLRLDPEQARAKAMRQEIVRHFYDLGQSHFLKSELNRAREAVQNGLSVQATDPALIKLRTQIDDAVEEQRQIRLLLDKAHSLFAAGQVIEPDGESAVDYFTRVLAREPRQPDALSGLQKAEDHVVRQIDTAIWENRLQLAELYLKKAKNIFPASKPLEQVSHKLQSARAKNAPRITHILISQHPIVSLLRTQEVVTTTPSISVGFSYTNLPANTNVLNFRLDSLSEKLNLVNKKLLVADRHGEHIFTVQHPLATFLPGQYRITLRLENKTLLSHDFSIRAEAPSEVQLR